MNLIKYKRVSGASQVTDGDGLEAQDVALDAWALAEGHTFVGSCTDEGLSGTLEIENRPGLSCAMVEAKESGAGIAFWKLDRLARDLIQQELILGEFKRADIAVFSTVSVENDVMRDDAADPSRTFVRQILGAVAQYERALICLRMAGGKAVKRSKGGRTDGCMPYGWRTSGKGVLHPIEAEQAVLAEIRSLRASGLSLRSIAAEMTARGHRPRFGADRWAHQTIAGLLAQPLVPLGAYTSETAVAAA